jgi:hypothetical protein
MLLVVSNACRGTFNTNEPDTIESNELLGPIAIE